MKNALRACSAFAAVAVLTATAFGQRKDYDPPAFMLRRSMPWTSGSEQGLEFVAYGKSLDAYERVLRRMAGLEDGIVDALFSFSQPVTGSYYWCPPVAAGRLDLRRLKL